MLTLSQGDFPLSTKLDVLKVGFFSRTQQHGGQWVGLLLHLFGMSLGVTIMLLIALYEHQLKNVFGDKEY